MAYIPEEVIDQVRQNVDILDIIGQFVDLQKRGKNYFGKCPFHDENTPSFTVEANKQFYKCFSCGKGGNVFNFLMDLEGYSFPQAVKEVAQLANLKLDFNFDQLDQGNSVRQYNEEEQTLIDIHEELANLYHYLLMNTKAGHQALAYLEDRGLKSETLVQYHIGWSPYDGQLTFNHVKNKGYDSEAIVASGIFVGEGPEKIDRFKGRIVFPLRDKFGHVLGFSGRILEADSANSQAKYLNSPETAIFQKNNFLFNLDLAQDSIRKEKEIILFEGFMDVIHSYQAGVKHGVASLGTSLTDRQIQVLYRSSRQLLLAYDGDKPGLKASKRALEHLAQQSPSMRVNLLMFPSGMDPDEFIGRYGEQRYQQFIQEQRMTPIAFYRHYYQQEFSLATDQGKIQYIKAMLAVISRLSSTIEQDVYLQELSEDTGVDKRSLQAQLHFEQETGQQEEQFSEVSREKAEVQLDKFPLKKYSSLQRFELQLLNRLLTSENAWYLIKNIDENFHFESSSFESVYLLLWAYRQREGESIDIGNFYQSLRSDADRRIVIDAQAMNLPPECTGQEISDLIYQIKDKSHYQDQIRQINQDIADAKQINDYAKISDLNQQRIHILRQMKLSKKKSGEI
ncbi:MULTISPECIES: DNA primase [Aerococcus]|nr:MULTISPECIES: DNA primase [Aerococcus]MCY3026129.1 DNA primase [Aerococcus loyolae]MCY3027601.1 DNA primase [Aerococcus loyolae]MCY3029472.1 DNA primase [Aerococcus loyolae]MDK6231328.1 DNA primase [Aerococcus urinae]MDK6258233.1 DNA primase [Aerococcus urinae]